MSLTSLMSVFRTATVLHFFVALKVNTFEKKSIFKACASVSHRTVIKKTNVHSLTHYPLFVFSSSLHLATEVNWKFYYPLWLFRFICSVLCTFYTQDVIDQRPFKFK